MTGSDAKFLFFNVHFAESEQAFKYKIVFLNSVFLLAIAVAIGVGIFRALNADALVAVIDFTFSGLSLALLLFLNRHKEKHEAVASIALWFSFFLFFALFILTKNPARISLFFPQVAAAFFLKGRTGGRFWLFFTIVAIVGWNSFSDLATRYSPIFSPGYPPFDIASTCLYLGGLFFILENYESYKEEQRRLQQEQEQEVLRRTEERWRRALEGVGDAVWDWDMRTDDFRYSKGFAHMLGYDEGDLIHQREGLLRLINPIDRSRVEAELAACETGSASTLAVECRMQAKSGGLRWMLSRGRVTDYDPDGRPLRMAGTISDITERRNAEAALRTQALSDPLTGLANRSGFLMRLQEACASARRRAKIFAVLHFDLDHFKDVNDAWGQAAGDRVLQAVAARIRTEIRETDHAARFGGDEFAILRTDVDDPSDAGVFAAKLMQAIAEPYRLDGDEAHITLSVGISLFDPKVTDPETMLRQAEIALYQAKDEGGDRISFLSPEIDEDVRRRVALINELRAAIETSELELYYQPEVELSSGRIVVLEALVRWNNPRRGLLKPDAFISLAERSGFIDALGRWVLDQACRQIRNWKRMGIAPPVVAINVSAAELNGSAEFEQYFEERLKQWRVSPNEIELELTESVLMRASKEHGDMLARIRNRGTSIAIDDFGTGFSSLAYLGSYPVSRLKIAQQFILGIPANAAYVAITNATLGLAQNLGLDVVAEGVETREQIDFLIRAGCKVGQGFYFSEPVTAEQATELLRRGRAEPGPTGASA